MQNRSDGSDLTMPALLRDPRHERHTSVRCAVDSQAQFVNLVRQRIHSRGKPGHVYNDVISIYTTRETTHLRQYLQRGSVLSPSNNHQD